MQTPVNYVEALKEHYGSTGFPPYQWTINESAPLTPLTKPLQRGTQPWNATVKSK